ncbi:MAG: NADP(H)-dependent aldo-keto reductase [Candidatus Kaiserbacteria bacterium]|nr:NADP(H)-dependent aldo-keto reductase [Candidatus Kaiserbacteria bacterium]
MEYRKLSNTGLEVSKICLGTMNWGQQNTEAEAHEQLDYATTVGEINFIDSAEMYPIPPEPEKQGTTERYVGNWLAKRGKRDDLIIASKVASSNLIRTRPIEGDRTRYNKKNILAAIDGTLSRLQTDYIDLYQVHWPERSTNFFGIRNFENIVDEDVTPIEETLEALGEIVKAGKVRFIGISNETPWGLSEYLRVAKEKGLPRVITIQNQYSIMNRLFEIGLSEMCMHENVGLLPYSSLGGGALSGKYLGGANPPGARHTLYARNRARYNAPHLQSGIQAYVDLAHKHGLDPAQMALSFTNDRPFVTANIIGCTSMEQLKADIASADIKLSADVMKDIEALYTVMPDPQA